MGSTSFRFAQNTLHDFRKNSIELIVALSLTNTSKMTDTKRTCKTDVKLLHVENGVIKYEEAIPDNSCCQQP